jgi:putative peptide-modifying radical SAM enzyme
MSTTLQVFLVRKLFSHAVIINCLHTEEVVSLNFYVTLTTSCNLQCRYCYGKSCEDFGSDFHGLEIDYSTPRLIDYGTQSLKSFLQEDPSPLLIFYGGEPLLQMRKMEEIIGAVPAARFVLQTNGLLLDRMNMKYANKFDSIFVSLDGDEALSDYYRGKGTYKRVIGNIKKIRDNGYGGEIVARMTVGEETEIDHQVLALAENVGLPVSSVHWQLDALFWQNDFPKRHFSDWVTKNYNPRLRKLIHVWVDRMRKKGEVLRLYPLVGVMQSLLRGEPSRLRCGAGWSLFNIQTDGNITPCPVMAGLRDFYLGNICETPLRRLKDAVSVSEPCDRCDVLSVCGGRCLYANVTKLWGEDGFRQVCGTVRSMIDGLQEVLPEIRVLIDVGRIRLSDFEYQKYNGCEIIP